jgi:hypothetical protein
VTRDPPRLTIAGATEIERRLLDAAAAERPSPEITRRMGAALGFSAPSSAPSSASTTSTAAAAQTAKMNAPMNATANVASTWAGAGVLALAVSASVVGVWSWSRSHVGNLRTTNVAASIAMQDVSGFVSPVSAPTPPDSAPSVSFPPPVAAAARAAAPTRRHVSPSKSANNLHGEIALIDAARASIRAGAPERSLALLHRYEVTYAGGTLRPEAAALRVEALARSGRTEEARALAREFLAKHPDSPLGERVARIADVPPS